MDILRLRLRYWDEEALKMYDVAKFDMWGTNEGWTVDLCGPLEEQLFNVVGVNTDNLMQHTGCKDERSNDIYEGDIVSFTDIIDTESGHSEQDCIGVVQWDKETASFEVTNRLSAESYEILDGECTVIGNIYENQNLI